MQVNVGSVDRFLRTVVGLSLMMAAVHGQPLGWIGLVPFLTALFRFCPVYRAFGLSSCSPEERAS